MWYGIMKELHCKASSTWSVCGREKEEAFTTHRQLGDRRQELKSQLDYIIGPKRRDKINCGTRGTTTRKCEDTGRKECKTNPRKKKDEEVDWMEAEDR